MFKSQIFVRTRSFCAELCDIGQTQYRLATRLAMKAYKATTVTKPSAKSPYGSMHYEFSLQGSVQGPSYPGLIDIPESNQSNSTFIPTDRCSLEEVDAAFENDLALSGATKMKDLLDNEYAPATLVQPVTAVSDNFWYSPFQGIAESKDHNYGAATYDTYTDNSDVDDTMFHLQKMRELLNQHNQMHSSMAALAQEYCAESTLRGFSTHSA